MSVNNFSRLCCTFDHIDGPQILDALNETVSPLLPSGTRTVRFRRMGVAYLIKGNPSRDEVQALASRVLSTLESPLSIDGERLTVNVSIGLADGNDGIRPEKLLDQAQFAQHLAAQNEEPAFSYYDAQRADETRRKTSLSNDLYTALDNEEFFLTYQPVLDLESATLTGAEALIRWDHPKRGLVSPGDFIPLAEKTGQIIFLDRWVMRRAIEQAAEWSNRFDWDQPIGVNVSAWQFRDDHLIDKIKSILTDTSVSPSRLKLELTETALMKDLTATANTLRKLKRLGVKIALDDFGTGQASFQYLQQFPIDELKIDRSFLQFDDVTQKNQRLVESMIETGHRTDTRILAEGIETQQQLEYLRNRGCQLGQGFLFSRPIGASAFAGLIQEDREREYT